MGGALVHPYALLKIAKIGSRAIVRFSNSGGGPAVKFRLCISLSVLFSEWNINLQHTAQTKRSNRKRKANVRLGEISETCAPKTISTKITKNIAVVKNVTALHEHDYTEYGFR